MYELDILCGISKVPFEIPRKMSNPYIERYDFYPTLNFKELLDLRAHICFWTPLPPPPTHTHTHTPGMIKGKRFFYINLNKPGTSCNFLCIYIYDNHSYKPNITCIFSTAFILNWVLLQLYDALVLGFIAIIKVCTGIEIEIRGYSLPCQVNSCYPALFACLLTHWPLGDLNVILKM